MTSIHLQDLENTIPKKRQDLLKWDGWGYKDTQLVINEDIFPYPIVTGGRYCPKDTGFPSFRNTIENVYGIKYRSTTNVRQEPTNFPDIIFNSEFMDFVKEKELDYSTNGADRLYRAHGHTLDEIYTVRNGHFERIPDIVIWPDCHETVEKIVVAAVRCKVAIVPYGGGTNVTKSLLCSKEESRMIVSLDMSQMNRILWINEENLTARIEAGIIGQDLEKKLQAKGFTAGHEPDSYEFSSLGGWVATRASGMKKNTYGNIEDLVVQIKAITPRGAVERYTAAPRVSSGPDIHNFILGSEGILGIVTEVTMKIRPFPQCKTYGSIVFPDFESGVSFMRKVAKERCQPTSIRLMDNEQFKLGQSLKPASGYFSSMMDWWKKKYLINFKGIQIDSMCVCTLLFEGNNDDIVKQQEKIYRIGGEFGGIAAGESAGKQGYFLTFLIAYIRDMGLDFDVMAESYETAVPWDKVIALCRNVKHRFYKETQRRNIKFASISCRVTQTYDAGACVYFYSAFNSENMSNPVKVYEEIEDSCRDEILASGGSISHHHGVGQLRSKFLTRSINSTSVGAIKALKEYFDPTNILSCSNLLDITPKAKL